jgi:hypothetical protein
MSDTNAFGLYKISWNRGRGHFCSEEVQLLEEFFCGRLFGLQKLTWQGEGVTIHQLG